MNAFKRDPTRRIPPKRIEASGIKARSLFEGLYESLGTLMAHPPTAKKNIGRKMLAAAASGNQEYSPDKDARSPDNEIQATMPIRALKNSFIGFLL